MGFLGLVDASKLAAVYSLDTQQLTLMAEGTVIEATYGYRFDALKSFAVTYELQAWSGPLTGQKKPYSYSQTFTTVMPCGVKDVKIIVADRPQGVPVHITFSGFVEAPIKWTMVEDLEEATPTHNNDKTMVMPQDVINALYGEPFTIKQHAEVPQLGSIELKYDTSFLMIENTGIEDGNIVWKFKPLQTGNTQVMVNVYGGVSSIIARVVWSVRIFVLPLEPGPVIPPSTELNAASEVLSFLGRVNIAMRLVKAQYPDAAVYIAGASTNDPNGASSSEQLTQMTVVFRTEKGVATINSTGYGSFGPVSFRAGPLLGNASLDWPPSLTADEADELLKNGGHTGKYTSLVLKKPLFTVKMQDFYVFRMRDGGEISIACQEKSLLI